jgi:hypothetical protein
MEKPIFDDFWEKTAKKEITKTINAARLLRTEPKENNINFRDTVYSRYQCERENFRRTTGIAEDNRLDRHKVSAFFYAAFVNNTDGHSFNVFNSKNARLKGAEYIVTHETAFNIVCGILETFIINDSGVEASYRKYVEDNGLTEPKLICFDKINVNSQTSYKEETLKQLILAQREGKLSVSLLAVFFSAFERETINSYELAKAAVNPPNNS